MPQSRMRRWVLSAVRTVMVSPSEMPTTRAWWSAGQAGKGTTSRRSGRKRRMQEGYPVGVRLTRKQCGATLILGRGKRRRHPSIHARSCFVFETSAEFHRGPHDGLVLDVDEIRNFCVLVRMQ